MMSERANERVVVPPMSRKRSRESETVASHRSKHTVFNNAVEWRPQGSGWAITLSKAKVRELSSLVEDNDEIEAFP